MRTMYTLVIIVLIIVTSVFTMLSFKSVDYSPGPKQQHARGSGNLTIVEYSDFQCPYCGAVQPTIDQILSEYDGRVQVQYKHFPLPSHQYGEKAAEASECAAEHGKFWKYHDKLFANQDKLYSSALKDYAAQIGLNVSSFSACLDSGVMKKRVAGDRQEGFAVGVSGTPTFVIGSQKISGNQPVSVFRSAINRALGELA